MKIWQYVTVLAVLCCMLLCASAIESETDAATQTTYVLDFDANGGHGGPGHLVYGPTRETSHTFTIPQTVPTWSGRDFLGWSFAANGAGDLLQPGESLTMGSSGDTITTTTLFASWTDGGYIYTLDFDANGGSGAPGQMTYGPTQQTYHIWTIPQTVPTWSGHQFMGWATSPSASDPELYYQPGGSYEVEARYDRNATLYAIWEDAPVTTFIVYFNANGGTGAPSTINSGPISTIRYEVTVPETVPTRSGYQFLGWSTDQSAETGTYQPGDTFSMIPSGASTESITLYAIWASSYTYTLSFDATDGSGAPSALTYGPTSSTSHTFTLPTAEPIPSDPDTYEFGGWSIYPDGSGVLWQPGEQYTLTATDSSEVTRTLYASWTRIAWEFSLSFVAPGATNVPENMSSGTVATAYYTFTIPSNLPVKDGWTFTGWDASGGASGTYQPGAQITVTAPTVLYAEFVSAGYVYTLTFDGNGATQPVPNPISSLPTTATSYTFDIPQSHPDRPGHDFEGWATSSDGNPEYQTGGTITLYAPNYEQTLYAIWSSSTETEVQLIGPSTVSVGDTIEITASVIPEGSGGVTWLRVSGADLIDDIQTSSTTWTATATAVGSITIRATATDGSGANEDITIQITDVPVSGDVTVQIAGSTSARVGETRTLTAVVLPSDLGNRTVTWKIVTGSDLITYETSETWRGGEFTYEATGTGTVTITATSAADPDAAATITITIGSATSDDSEVIGPQGIVGALGAALFGGSSSIAGVVLFAIILAVLFAIIREPLPVVLLGIPVLAIFTLLGILDMDMVILLIIVVTVGLALIARKMWRD